MEPLKPGDPDRVGPYRVLARLGAGGMGVVYLGRSRTGRKVAVKVIRKVFAGDPEYRARFRREIEAARKVTEVFTAPVLDADAGGAQPWLATVYLPGLSLWDAVETYGGLPPTAVRALAAGLAEALAGIHRAGVVHRDLKPGNVILTVDGPRVIDFGIARPEDATTITRAGVPVGTPGFMSPEQAEGARTGPAGDVFALGATLAYAASGAEPFGSGPAQSRAYRVMAGQADLGAIAEPWLRELISACLRADPRGRPSAAGVLDGLGPVGQDAPSLRSTGWLPPEIAEEIDRRTAEVRRTPRRLDTVRDRPALAAEDSDVERAVTAPPPVGAETYAGAERTEPDGGRTGELSRRTLMAGAGVAVLAAGGVGTLAWAWTSAAGHGSPSARSGSPTPLPSPVPRWRQRAGADLADLTATDRVLLAAAHEGVRAMDPRTGRVLWKRSKAFSPKAVGDVAYLVTDEGNRVRAVRADSGKTLWTYEVDFHEFPGEELAVTGSVVCFGSERVSAVNTDDGRRRWTSKVNAEYGISVADGQVVAVSPTALTALDADTGRTRWKYPMDYGDYQLVGPGLVFACDRFGTLHAVHAADGTPAWRRPKVGGWGSQFGGGLLYTEGQDGEVLALKAATGEVAWSRRLVRLADDPRAQSTASGLVGGTLYVACIDGNVYALDAADGRVQWVYGAEKPLRIRPVGADGLLIIGTMDGYIRALAAPARVPNPGGGRRGSP